jgi:hypothetical protein
MRAMKLIVAIAALLACISPSAETAEKPNQPVFRSGPWFVVRSVRDGGSVVACTGFYRANRRVQLSKDMLVVKTAEDVKSVALGFDDAPFGSPRPLTASEHDLKAIAFAGDDFAKLSHSNQLRIEVETPQGVMRHELELNGLAGALDNIDKGCPVPADPPKPVPKRRHARH